MRSSPLVSSSSQTCAWSDTVVSFGGVWLRYRTQFAMQPCTPKIGFCVPVHSVVWLIVEVLALGWIVETSFAHGSTSPQPRQSSTSVASTLTTRCSTVCFHPALYFGGFDSRANESAAVIGLWSDKRSGVDDANTPDSDGNGDVQI